MSHISSFIPLHKHNVIDTTAPSTGALALCEICSYNTNSVNHSKMKGHSGNHLGSKRAKKSSHHVDKGKKLNRRQNQSSNINYASTEQDSLLSIGSTSSIINKKALCPKCTFNVGHTNHDKTLRHCGVCIGTKKVTKK